jgi:hypothetical protein
VTRRALQLSLPLPSFTARQPDSWGFVLERARLLDQAGVDAVPALARAGVTDFRPGIRVPDDLAATEDLLDELVVAFRGATAG